MFTTGVDPVGRGLVASLSRPGGNITGITQLTAAATSKRVRLLRDLLPNAKVIGQLANPNNLAEDAQEAEQEAARLLGMSVETVFARNEDEIVAAFSTLAQKRVDAIDVFPEALFSSRAELMATLAAKHALPTMFSGTEFPRAGGLMSYGSDIADSYRQAGVYAGRVLKGEKPADLPVVQPTKFDLVINLKAAKALGLAVPPTLLAIADEVIE